MQWSLSLITNHWSERLAGGAELQGAGKSTARKWNPYGMAAGLACQVQCSWLSGLGCWQALK